MDRGLQKQKCDKGAGIVKTNRLQLVQLLPWFVRKTKQSGRKKQNNRNR
jgi:hypothetical protein